MTTEEKVREAKNTMNRKSNRLRVNFNRIYPFTTENISGYIPYFKLKNKSLLTVGSSHDQTINAALFGCRDITIVDVCPFSKEYFELKKSSLMSLSQEEYLELLTYPREYRPLRKPKGKMIDKKLIKKIEEALSYEESFPFWRLLMKDCSPETIRERLFSTDEYPKEIIQAINPYLQGDNYKRIQEEIKTVSPRFIQGNILKEKYSRQFDNIWLSNLFDYRSNKTTNKALEQFVENLSEDGVVLLYYLFSTSINGESAIYHQIYDPKKNIRSFPGGCEYYDIKGVDSYLHNNNVVDGIITYQKRH